MLERTVLVAVALGPLLLILAALLVDGSEEAGAVLAFAGAGLLVFAAFVGPVLRWGPSAIFLTLGVILILGGIVSLVGLEVATTTAETLHAGDNDGDGRIDEDPAGDADGSAEDPTKADGLEEARYPDDDDSDGEVDEDLPPLTVQEPAAAQAMIIGQRAALAAVAAGLVLVGLFALVLNLPARRAG